MGRAERRRTERNARINDRKNKLLITQEELHRIKDRLSYQESKYSTENLMACFGLVLSRRGLPDEEIVSYLEDINKLMDDILSGEHIMQEYLNELENRTGIVIKCRD